MTRVLPLSSLHRSLLTTLAVLAGLLGLGAAAASRAAGQAPGGPEGEVASLLQELIRINTSNPPGNEAQVAELLRAKLAPLGFEVDVIPTPVAGKAHLIARLRARTPVGKPILLAGHADVVGVERELWSLDPFAGISRDGFAFGRGALDFKGGLAAFTVAAMRVARSGAALRRDVILLAEADEEGGAYGTSWLAENFWAKIDAEFSLNEGGWAFKDAGGVPRFASITTIDKNSLSVTLRTRGTSTHSSRPKRDSALRRLVRALNRIEEYETAPALSPLVRGYLRTFAAAFPKAPWAGHVRALATAKSQRRQRELLRRLLDTDYGPLFNGLSRTLFVPTIVAGGFRSNVLPGTAQATVNVRLLPGARPRPALRELERVVGDPQVRIEPITSAGQTVEETLDAFDRRAEQPPSPTDTPLWASLVSRSRQQWPAARVTEALFEAGTDAVPWRSRGIPVYGIYPYPITAAELEAMHGNDERVPLEGLEQGTDLVEAVLRDVAVGP